MKNNENKNKDITLKEYIDLLYKAKKALEDNPVKGDEDYTWVHKDCYKNILKVLDIFRNGKLLLGNMTYPMGDTGMPEDIGNAYFEAYEKAQELKKLL